MTSVANAAPNNPPPTTAEQRRPSIAVVDDDSGFAGYLRTFLSLRGYEARAYSRGDEIVAAIRQGEPPDIVLLDVAMPGMDGLSVIRETRRHHADIPIIIITAYSTEASAIEAINLGVSGYLTKPFRMERVLAMAACALGEPAAV